MKSRVGLAAGAGLLALLVLCAQGACGPDAAVVVNQDDALFVVIGGFDRADLHAGSVLAVQAGKRKVVRLPVRVGSHLQDLDPLLPWRDEMLGLAGVCAHLAPVAEGQVSKLVYKAPWIIFLPGKIKPVA